jgi:ABC-2 family transporter protein
VTQFVRYIQNIIEHQKSLVIRAMGGFRVVFAKELQCFAGSDRGMFILYSIIVVVWSALLATRSSDSFDSGPLWLVFFSVVITANFSNSIFVSERTNGSLEILITSGLSRNAVLYGKLCFIIIMSVLFGAVCIVLSRIFDKYLFYYSMPPTDIESFLLYTSSTFLNVALSAYFSIKLTNQRMLHFVNMFILGLFVGAYMALAQYITVSVYYLVGVMFIAGAGICWRAQRLYHSEKIIQSVSI